MNEKIVEVARQVIAREIPFETRKGWCLRFSRLLLERALGINFYSLCGDKPAGRDWFAIDVEERLTARGWSVPFEDRLPGDLVFSQPGNEEGHVGILLDADTVLENTWANRRVGEAITAHVRTTPLSAWDKPTTIIRIFKERQEPAAPKERVPANILIFYDQDNEPERFDAPFLVSIDGQPVHIERKLEIRFL